MVTCPGRQKQPKCSRHKERRCISAWSRWAVGRRTGSDDHHQSAVKFCDPVPWWKTSQKRSARRGTQMLTAGICDCQLAVSILPLFGWQTARRQNELLCRKPVNRSPPPCRLLSRPMWRTCHYTMRWENSRLADCDDMAAILNIDMTL